ncbi:MAG: patatin family protein [Lachnospiraceae bacterium]|nr:patatin family protein [Lachnospiraceae bacterium]
MIEIDVKKGLILEGGAMRGMFTTGVLDVFMENDITFDGTAGISAGATFGCNFKSKQPGRALRYNLKYCKDWRYCSFRSLIRTGDLYGVDFCYHELPDKLDVFDRDTFASNPMEFYMAATDVDTGRPVYHKCTDGGELDLLWMQASASMPAVSHIVHIGDRKLLDGGITDAVPFKFMEYKGYNRNVIVLTQPDGFRKEKSKAAPVFEVMLRKYPKLVVALRRRPKMYNRQMSDIKLREIAGTAFVIRPPEPLGISRTENDPDELQRVYDIGRQIAENRLEELRDFLK